jgi:hypothetical protein
VRGRAAVSVKENQSTGNAPQESRGGGTATASPPPLTWQRGAATLQPSAAVGRGPKGVRPSTSQALKKLSARTTQRWRINATRVTTSPRRSRKTSESDAFRLASGLSVMTLMHLAQRTSTTFPHNGLLVSDAFTSQRGRRLRHLITQAAARPLGPAMAATTAMLGMPTLKLATSSLCAVSVAAMAAEGINDTEDGIGSMHPEVSKGFVGMERHAGKGNHCVGDLVTAFDMINHMGERAHMLPLRGSVVAWSPMGWVVIRITVDLSPPLEPLVGVVATKG